MDVIIIWYGGVFGNLLMPLIALDFHVISITPVPCTSNSNLFPASL
jgi:hypothetical protein